MTFRDVEEFGGEIVHLGREHVHAGGQEVVEHLRGYRGYEADRRGYQGFRDSRCNRLDIRRMGRREAQEGRHYSPYRAEQADERAGRAGGREERYSGLDFRKLDVGLPPHRARHVVHAAQVRRESTLGADRLAFRPRQLEQFLVARAKDLCDRALVQPDARGMNRGEVFRFPENRNEALGLTPRTRDLGKLVINGAPAPDREADQRPEYDLDHRPRAEEQVHHSEPTRATHLHTSRSIKARLRHIHYFYAHARSQICTYLPMTRDGACQSP